MEFAAPALLIGKKHDSQGNNAASVNKQHHQVCNKSRSQSAGKHQACPQYTGTANYKDYLITVIIWFVINLPQTYSCRER